MFEENEGLLGAWAVLFLRAVVQDPAGCETLLAHFTERSLSPSGITNPSAPGISNFSRLTPTAHTLACLRFTARVTANGARLTTGSGGLSGGLTPGRAGFAPAGRQTKFHGGIASLHSSSTSLAWSHHNPLVPGSSPGGPIPLKEHDLGASRFFDSRRPAEFQSDGQPAARSGVN